MKSLGHGLFGSTIVELWTGWKYC